MNNIDTVLSTFLTGYLKCNKKNSLTSLPPSQTVFSGYLPYNISYREGSDTQTDAFKFF